MSTASLTALPLSPTPSTLPASAGVRAVGDVPGWPPWATGLTTHTPATSARSSRRHEQQASVLVRVRKGLGGRWSPAPGPVPSPHLGHRVRVPPACRHRIAVGRSGPGQARVLHLRIGHRRVRRSPRSVFQRRREDAHVIAGRQVTTNVAVVMNDKGRQLGLRRITVHVHIATPLPANDEGATRTRGGTANREAPPCP